jgi:hypothetical protein
MWGSCPFVAAWYDCFAPVQIDFQGRKHNFSSAYWKSSTSSSIVNTVVFKGNKNRKEKKIFSFLYV